MWTPSTRRPSPSTESDSASSKSFAEAGSIVTTVSPRRSSRTFQPTQEGIAAASDFLDEVLSAETSEQVNALAPPLHIILDEICSNIVKHSRASGFALDIEFAENPAAVKLTFSDDGVAYDPLSHADPDTTLPAEERPIGGLGLLMVKKMSDAISYRRFHNRNVLVVQKRIG